jgi:hypothetical protein
VIFATPVLYSQKARLGRRQTRLPKRCTCAIIQGAATIGVVVHSGCRRAGHGPGVTTIMTCGTSLVEPIIDPSANMADLLGIGTPASAGAASPK